MQSDVQEYWNSVDRAVLSKSNGKILDNFEKRRVLVEALLKYPLMNARILELGTGLGLTAFSVALINGRMTYTGLDISERYAQVAREKFQLDVIVADITDPLPVPTNNYDVVFAFDCLEHIQPEKREGLFQELDRVLGKNDRILFINNPLSESDHDQKYDFVLTEKDIARLCEVTDTRILEVKLLMHQNNVSQFIVLGTMKENK